MTSTLQVDPRLGVENERFAPTKDLKEVQIGPLGHKVTNIGPSLFEEEEFILVNQLRTNVGLFAWTPFDMAEIDTKVVCHLLVVGPSVKPVSRKCKVSEENKVSIDEEGNKLAIPISPTQNMADRIFISKDVIYNEEEFS